MIGWEQDEQVPDCEEWYLFRGLLTKLITSKTFIITPVNTTVTWLSVRQFPQNPILQNL
jgi:hypothetical protein